MAKRTRKQKQRAVARRPTSAGAPQPAATGALGGVGSPVAESEVLRPATPAAVELGLPEPARRRVERVGGTAPVGAVAASRARPARAQPAGYIQPLESEDAAIPFDRVPYVPADLRRVAIIASVMIALIIVADIIVNIVVK